jgi:hypothetical protein
MCWGVQQPHKRQPSAHPHPPPPTPKTPGVNSSCTHLFTNNSTCRLMDGWMASSPDNKWAAPRRALSTFSCIDASCDSGPQTSDRALVKRKRKAAPPCGPRAYCFSLSPTLCIHACHARARLLHINAPRPAPSLSPFPSTNASLRHQPQQYRASLMRTVIMMLIRSSSLMAPWVLSTSALPWSKHTVSSKYLREEVEMVFLGHSAQHAPVHLLLWH